MKKLSDYMGDAAIDLWADLLDPLTAIINDKTFQEVIRSGESKLKIAQTILKTHKKEAVKIIQRIDPEPLNGLNVISKLIAILADIGQSEEIKGFFGFAEQEKTDKESSGLPMENTEEKEK